MDEFAKIPPQAKEIEMAVLGALMIEPGVETEVMGKLHPEVFYEPAHQKIYKAIEDLFEANKPIDTLTVIKQLEENGDLDEVGGAVYITELSQRIGTASHLAYHAQIIYEKYLLRKLISFASELEKKAYSFESNIEDLLDEAERELFEIASENIRSEIKPIKEIIKESIEHLQELKDKEIIFSGLPSGFSELDRITSGWQKSDLIIVAARPSMGKTAFVLSMARNMAVEYGHSVAIFSLEMSAMQLVNRLISAEAEITSGKLRTGKLTDEDWLRLEERIKKLEQAQIFIDDTPSISLFELRAKCRRLKSKYNIDVVFVDYLQLMSGPPELKKNREQEVSYISRGLKALAKEIDVPVIALSQLNRAVEHRTTKHKRPQLSDLRESGAIEQDADIVVFIHRPEKVGITEIDGVSTEGLAEIIIAKHRNGALADIKLKFIDKYAKFVEYEDERELDEDGFVIGSSMNDDTDSPDSPDSPDNDNDDFGFSDDFPNTDFDDPF